MNTLFWYAIVLSVGVSIKAVYSKIDVQELRCLVCQASLQELDAKVKKIDPSKKVDVGGYRLDADGNYRQKTVSQAKSETHLSELVDEVCEIMDDYVRARWKSNGTLTVIKLITDAGMNPEFSNVDVIQDDDLNKSLKFYCEGIMEEFEDSIIARYKADTDNIHQAVCSEDANLCRSSKESSRESPTDEL